MSHVKCPFLFLYNTTCYTGFTSSSCGGLRPRGETGQNKSFFLMFCLTLGQFWCSVLTSVTFSSALRNFQKNPKNPKKSQKNPKYHKISKIKKKKSKNPWKSPKTQKIHYKKPQKLKEFTKYQKNHEIWKHVKKNLFFPPQKLENFLCQKNAILLVLPIEHTAVQGSGQGL